MSKTTENPKTGAGRLKFSMSVLPANVMGELALALTEGARKYGRHNYRVGMVHASVYYDALMRHMSAWWEGEDIDPESGLSHLVKAAACLIVLRDAMVRDAVDDDRPPPSPEGWQARLNELHKELTERYPDAKEPITIRDVESPEK